MLHHAVTFIIGAIIGVAIMLTSAPEAERPEKPQPEPAMAQEPAAGVRARAPVPDRVADPSPAPDRPAVRAVPATQPAQGSAETVPVGMPITYQDMIGPPLRVPAAPRLHERFEQESRDEAWAFSMETGVQNHIRRVAAADVFVEYLECRTTMCEIAGFETGTGDGFTTILDDMSKAGWWQADGPVLYLGGEAAGLRRFVVMLRRYPESP